MLRMPLLNTRERILGYELAWQPGTGGRKDAENLNGLADFIHSPGVQPSDSLLREQVLFLPASFDVLRTRVFSRMPADGLVLSIQEAELSNAFVTAEIRELRERGFSFSLRSKKLDEVDRALLPLFSYIESSIADEDFAGQLQAYRALELPGSVRLVARDVTSWEQYDLCAAEGVYAFAGHLHLTPRSGEPAKDLTPQQKMVLQLMDMVKRGEDVRQLEDVLKRDAALSYKLLRYINSAGFSLDCEIQSLKHAVTLLGYAQLYRWLALLLTTATMTGYSPVLMQTAVIRGRFVELLGQILLPKGESDNLFVAGLFSLLDRLLGVPMEEVLAQLPLSEAVSQALLTRSGVFGPYLALTEASEMNAPEVASMAASLGISLAQLNQAQLSALAWVQGLTL